MISPPNQTNGTGLPATTAKHTGITNMEYILIAIAFIIVILNIYVLTLFVRKRVSRRNSNLLLLSLALSDLFTGLVTVPLLIATTPLRQIDFEKYKLVFILADMMTVFSASVTILNLCAITGERYVRVCLPMTRLTIVNEVRIIIIIIILIWLIAGVFSLFPFAWLYKALDSNVSENTLAKIHSRDTNYSMAGAFLFIIPVIALIIAFCRMFYAIHQLGISEKATFVSATESKRRQRERKAVFIFSIMFVAFLICWTPWIVLRPIISKMPWIFMTMSPVLLNIFMLIRFLSSIVNPLLYTMHKYDFNRAFKDDKKRFVAFLHGKDYISFRRVSESGSVSSRKNTHHRNIERERQLSETQSTPLGLKKGTVNEQQRSWDINEPSILENGDLRRPRAFTTEENLTGSSETEAHEDFSSQRREDIRADAHDESCYQRHKDMRTNDQDPFNAQNEVLKESRDDHVSFANILSDNFGHEQQVKFTNNKTAPKRSNTVQEKNIPVAGSPSIFKTSFMQKIFNTQDDKAVRKNAWRFIDTKTDDRSMENKAENAAINTAVTTSDKMQRNTDVEKLLKDKDTDIKPDVCEASSEQENVYTNSCTSDVLDFAGQSDFLEECELFEETKLPEKTLLSSQEPYEAHKFKIIINTSKKTDSQNKLNPPQQSHSSDDEMNVTVRYDSKNFKVVKF